jgi:hypothetical protein
VTAIAKSGADARVGICGQGRRTSISVDSSEELVGRDGAGRGASERHLDREPLQQLLTGGGTRWRRTILAVQVIGLDVAGGASKALPRRPTRA